MNWLDNKRVIGTGNFILIAILFVVSFTGSLVSIATVEMEEAKKAYQKEERLVKMDSSRIDSVFLTISRAGRRIEIGEPNRELADQRKKQNRIQVFIDNIPGNDRLNYLSFPDKVILTIAATFMGLLGAIIILVKESTYDGVKLNPELILKRATLGFSSGLLVIVLSYVLPGVITFNSEVEIKIETLTTFSLLAGMFFKTFFDKISKKI